MGDRITRRDLDGLANTFNRVIAGIDPDTPLWRRDGDRNVATVGMFYIDGAYGGWALHRVVSEGGGVSMVATSGHVPARELYNRMHAYLDGWFARDAASDPTD